MDGAYKNLMLEWAGEQSNLEKDMEATLKRLHPETFFKVGFDHQSDPEKRPRLGTNFIEATTPRSH